MGVAGGDDRIGEPSIEVRRRLRTLSWTRERREGRSSSRMPASRALLSGRGLCIVSTVGVSMVCFFDQRRCLWEWNEGQTSDLPVADERGC